MDCFCSSKQSKEKVKEGVNMKWHEKFKDPVVFGFTSDNFGHIEWRYQDQEKQWHQTWQPKRKDLVILTKLNAEDKKAVLDEMMVEIEKDNQLVKDRANKMARDRRARSKS